LLHPISELFRQDAISTLALHRVDGFCQYGEGASPSIVQKADPFSQEQGQCNPRECGDPVRNDLVEEDHQEPGLDLKDRCVYGVYERE
jgi:hypothetical protein